MNRWGSIGRTFLFIVGCAAILPVAQPFVPKLGDMRSEVILAAIAVLWAMLLTLLFVRWEKFTLSDVGVRPDAQSPLRFACGFVAGLLLVAAWWMALAASGYFTWSRNPQSSPLLVASALGMFVLLACREEIAFHGYPLKSLRGFFGVWGALLLIDILFVAEHRVGGWSWSQAILGSGAGSLLFGMAAVASRGLAVPIGIHAGWNFGHWSLGHKGGTAIWEVAAVEGAEEHAQWVGMASYLVVVGLATLLCWWWHRSHAATHRRSE